MRTKRMTGRLLSVLLCLVMVLGLLPTAAFAAGSSATTGNGTKGGPGSRDMRNVAGQYGSWQEAKDDGCIKYIDADGTVHFIGDVTDENTYVYGKHRNIILDDTSYLDNHKEKYVVHEGVTVNLRAMKKIAIPKSSWKKVQNSFLIMIPVQ